MRALFDVLAVFAGMMLLPVALAAPLLIAFLAISGLFRMGRKLGVQGRRRSATAFTFMVFFSVTSWMCAWLVTDWACGVFDISHATGLKIGVFIGSGWLIAMIWFPLGVKMAKCWPVDNGGSRHAFEREAGQNGLDNVTPPTGNRSGYINS